MKRTPRHAHCGRDSVSIYLQASLLLSCGRDASSLQRNRPLPTIPPVPERLCRTEEQEPRVDNHGAEDGTCNRRAVLRVLNRAHHGVVVALFIQC